MKIHDDHLYHGAALIQIAEHPQFTAINSMKLRRTIVHTAYKINDDIGIYLKYAQRPTKAFKEYPFTFNTEHLSDLAAIAAASNKLYIALVCVKGKEICCISYRELSALIERRKKAKKTEEDQYTILVTIPAGKSMRVYVNPPGEKKKILGRQLVVSRNAFPAKLFR
jgi:hypothetical protein